MDRRSKRFFVFLFALLVSAPAWAQYLGPIGSPLPLQHQRTPTTGIVRSGGMSSRPPFPSGTYRPPTYRRPVNFNNNRGGLYSPADSLGMRTANFAKFQGITRGLKF